MFTGLVEAVGELIERKPTSGGFPCPLAALVVTRGSIAVDGISLTIAGLGTDRFDVQVVPYTMEHTNLGRVQIRDRVNLECDMIGKYVVRAAELAGLTLTAIR